MITDDAIAFMSERAKEGTPFRASVNFTAPHSPWVDQHRVGRIHNTIRDLGIEDNALIVFMSDNGFNCGQHGIRGKGNATFAQNMYDTSVKVPLMITMPGRIRAGSTCDELLSGYDFMPTRMIRTREWKYVHRYPYGPHELFELVHDPGERVNMLADDQRKGA